MAAPNIVNVTTIYGRTTPYTVTTTAATLVTNNVANSVYKINTVMVTNNTGTGIGAYLEFYRSTTSYPIAFNVIVPAQATVVLIAKDTAIYLEENDTLRMYGSNTGLIATCSYEVIS
jgi:hypothetical protein